jgi:hypothetical protein
MRMFELIVADPTIGTRLGAWTVDGDVPVSFGQNAPVVMDPAGNRVAIGGPMVASAV